MNEIFPDTQTARDGNTVAYTELDSTGDKVGRALLFVFDLTVPEDSYAYLNAFTVFLISPNEREVMMRKGIRELNALSYVYYHGVSENTTKELIGEEAEESTGEEEEPAVQEVEDFVGVSHAHPKYWW